MLLVLDWRPQESKKWGWFRNTNCMVSINILENVEDSNFNEKQKDNSGISTSDAVYIIIKDKLYKVLGCNQRTKVQLTIIGDLVSQLHLGKIKRYFSFGREIEGTEEELDF